MRFVVRPGVGDERVDEPTRPADVAALRAQGVRQRPEFEKDLVGLDQVGQAAAVLPQNTCRVGLVEDKGRGVSARDAEEAWNVAEVTLVAKEALTDDEPACGFVQ